MEVYASAEAGAYLIPKAWKEQAGHWDTQAMSPNGVEKGHGSTHRKVEIVKPIPPTERQTTIAETVEPRRKRGS